MNADCSVLVDVTLIRESLIKGIKEGEKFKAEIEMMLAKCTQILNQSKAALALLDQVQGEP